MAVTVAGNLTSPIAGFLSAPLLARGLGVDGRGEVAAATAPLLLLSIALALGLPEAVTHFVARHHAHRRVILVTALSVVAGSGVLGALAVWFLRYPLSDGDSELAGLILLGTSGLVPALAVGVLRGQAAGLDQWGRIALEKSINAVGRLALVAGLFVTGHLSTVSATVVLSVTVFAGGMVYLMPPSASGGSADAQAPVLPRHVVGFGLRMWGGSLTGILLSRISQVLLVPLADTRELGLYMVAVQLAEAVMVFNSAMRDVTLARQSGRFSAHSLATTTRVSNLITFLSSLALAAVSPWLLPLLFGAEFADAVPMVWMLLLGTMLGNAGSVAGAGLVAMGRPGLRSIGMTAALVVNVTTLIVCAPLWGGMGAAVATAAGSFVAGSLNVLWVSARSQVRPWDFALFRAQDVAVLHRGIATALRRVS